MGEPILLKTTDAGIQLMIKRLADNEEIVFTGFKLGNGRRPEAPETLTDLVNPLLSTEITDLIAENNYVQISTHFDNNDVTDSFDLTEIGVYAHDADIDNDVLFAYINQEGFSEPILGVHDQKLIENTINVQIVMDSTENVTATIRSATYVSRAEFDEHTEEFEDHIHDYENPHRVSLEQLGFTDKQIEFPYTTSGENENVQTGDSISEAFRKIRNAIKKLFDHIANKDNPHEITALQINAAAADHKHSASAINSGTLSVERGGTGISNYSEGSIVYANTAKTLAQVQKPSAASFLMNDSSGVPYYAPITSIKFFHVGTTPPATVNIMWIDTTEVTGGLKYHNGTSWVHVPVGYAAES